MKRPKDHYDSMSMEALKKELEEAGVNTTDLHYQTAAAARVREYNSLQVASANMAHLDHRDDDEDEDEDEDDEEEEDEEDEEEEDEEEEDDEDCPEKITPTFLGDTGGGVAGLNVGEGGVHSRGEEEAGGGGGGRRGRRRRPAVSQDADQP